MKPIYRVTQPKDLEGRTGDLTVAYTSDMELAKLIKRSGFDSGTMDGGASGRVLVEKVYETINDLPRDMRMVVVRQ